MPTLASTSHTNIGARFLARIERGWRVVATALCFIGFGIGCVLVWGAIFPVLTLPLGRARRRAASQTTIRLGFYALVRWMARLGILTYEIRGAEKLNRRGLLILANHPTFLDVVLLMAFVRRADCIVKGALARKPFTRRPIAAAGFVCNDSGAGMVEDCIASIRAGNNLIIFPEGTRTPRNISKSPRLQRGAAQIAVRGGIDITPVRIRCAPLMLVKGEPWWRVPAQRSHFVLEVGDDIAAQPCTQHDAQENNEPLAARRLTDFLTSFFFPGAPSS